MTWLDQVLLRMSPHRLIRFERHLESCEAASVAALAKKWERFAPVEFDRLVGDAVVRVAEDMTPSGSARLRRGDRCMRRAHASRRVRKLRRPRIRG
jgi:hypothetical protein